jgi:hypothetical protein
MDDNSLLKRAHDPAEFGVLARETREMGQAYAKTASFYRDHLGKDPDTAQRLARDLGYADETILEEPPDQISWWALSALSDARPDDAIRLWERIKRLAREELKSGHRIARVTEWEGSPWQRAQFLAVRTSFREEWKPQGGIENALIDSMTLAYCSYLQWSNVLVMHGNLEGNGQRRKQKKDIFSEPPRLDAAESMEQSAAMMDRFHRMFLRTLRGLRDLRRYSPDVLVQNAQQVNVGAQQINIARGD